MQADMNSLLLPCLDSEREYEFGPEYKDCCENKAAGTLGETHLKPLSEMFTEEELQKIPVDNKAGKNYFGHFSQQLNAKAFQALSADGLTDGQSLL